MIIQRIIIKLGNWLIDHGFKLSDYELQQLKLKAESEYIKKKYK